MRSYSPAFEKILAILVATKQYTVGDFLVEFFGSPLDRSVNDRRATGRSLSHAKMLAAFIEGKTVYGVGDVLQWLHHASEEFCPTNEGPLWTLTVPYQSLKSGYAAMTSYAAQEVRRRLEVEQKAATDPHAGLHIFEPRKPGQEDVKLRVAWDNYGATTFSDVQAVLAQHQPLTFSYFYLLAHPGRHDEAKDAFRYRPPSVVCVILM
jgi:hypothetical protein